MTIQQILDAAMAVETEIEATPHGSPEFAAMVTRIAELQDELVRARSVQGQLIPDSSSPKTADEESAIYLERTLRSLMEVVNSKR